jgi:quercetin dioxygenase-like cupin family protein
MKAAEEATMRGLLFASVLALSFGLTSAAQETTTSDEPVKLPPITWQGTGCKGEELAVLMGCPFDQASPFVMRVRLEKGLHLPSHSYPVDIGVTMLSGVLDITFVEGNKKRVVRLRAGNFFKVPAYAFHTAHVIEKTELQDSGIGPVFVTWENEKCKPASGPDPLLPLCATAVR